MTVLDLVAKLTLDSSEYDKGLKDAESNASGIGSKIGGALKTVGMIGAAGFTAAAGAVVALTKSAVDSYANFEQLIGGVETLFGTQGMTLEEYAKSVGQSTSEAEKKYNSLQRAQNKMVKNADKAYKTAGVSANKYMEQATSMAAAMVSSLGGDTEKAADLVDQTIIDMSDNANKMGTSLESIQNAYSGFSKGNFTMLDNLKLGFGGTKEEMQRLLDKASEISGFKYDISSYSDIVDAIHVVQTEMGITGTTQKEASSTISGSLGMVKASWENVVTSFGRGGEETKTAISNLIDSVGTFLGNLIPTVTTILGNVIDGIKDVAPKIAEKLPEIINELLPKVIDAAVSLISGLVTALPGILSSIVTVFGGLVDTISNYLNEHFPEVGEVFDQVCGVAKDAINAVVTFVTDTLIPKFQEAWPTIKGIVESAFNAIKGFWETILKPAFDAIWLFVQDTVLPKFQEIWPKVQEAVSTVFTAIDDAWTNVLSPAFAGMKNILDTVKNKFEEVWPKVQSAVTTVFDAIDKAWTTGLSVVFTGIKNILDTVKNKFEEVWGGIQEFVGGVFEAIKTAWGDEGSGLYGVFHAIGTVIEKLKKTFEAVWKMEGGIGPLINSVWSTIKHTWDDTFSKVWEAISDVITTLQGTFEEVWGGIQSTVESVWGAIQSAWDSTLGPVFTDIGDAIDTVKEAFSGLFDKVSTVFGTGEGSIYGTINGIIDDIKGIFNFEWSLPKPKLPKINWGWNDLGIVSIPWFEVVWERKAYQNPFMFNSPTVMGGYGFGDGNGGEIVYGHDNLMRDIREATSGNRGDFSVVINVTQNPDENQEELATRISEIISQQYDRQEAVFA